ncbi:hypothetical protein DSL72_006110 [Monilinia vaccinii-corymbosi]|uniref:Uncharacterized protein n=1 Tax=Monilinia vaccinii-corymbosi TaxID=61207 RepID=A0A8A3PHR9_9HELO|nr:hypothetical protein DSL72_006110 [Monilinia vaccinii-corymbosi]
MPQKPYPVLAPRAQIPVIELRPPSRTARILTPAIVFTTCFALLLCAIAGILLGVRFFGRGVVLRVWAGFLVVGSTFSLLYLILHFIASIKNEAVGFVRPPESKVHAYAFIVARITLVCWMLSIITTSVIVSKPKIFGAYSIAIGIILTALEACQYPFQLPSSSTILPGAVNCRVSSFGDDLVDSNLTSLNPSAANILQSHSQLQSQSPSQFVSPSQSDDSIASLHDDYLFMGNEKEEWEKNQALAIANARTKREANIKRKPVPKLNSQSSMTSMPGEFPEETPLTPLLPTPALSRVKSKSKGWGINWSYLMNTSTESNGKCMIHSDSAISLRSNTGSECANCAGCASPSSIKQPANSVGLQRMTRPRNVTPSSSISDAAKRSPLSTMRTADSPDIAIKPDVALVPTTIPSSLDRTSPRKPPITQPLPIAVLNEMMARRPSIPPPPTTMPKTPPAIEQLSFPPKHATPLKRRPAEAKITKQPKSWKDSLPIRGGSFEIERKPVAKTKEASSGKAKSTAKPTPNQKTSETRPSLKSWKDSLPIRGGSFEDARSSANIRDIFPNISKGLAEDKAPAKPPTKPKQAPLKPKKNLENPTQTPTKSPNIAIVIKKKSAEIKGPGAFVNYAKQETPKERRISRELRIPGAFVDSGPSEPDKNQEAESLLRKKPQGVRPLKLRPKIKAADKVRPGEEAKAKAADKAAEDEPETLYRPAPRGPRDRPFKRKLFGGSNVGLPRNDRDSTQLLEAVKIEYTKVKPLRRLSLGEVSTGMGHLWDG